MDPLPPAPPGVLVERFAPPSGAVYRDAATPPTLRVSFHHAALTARGRALYAAIVLIFALLFVGFTGALARSLGLGVLWACTFAPLGILLAYWGVVSLVERVVIECDATRFRARTYPGLFYGRVDLPVVDVESVDVETSRLDGVEYRVFVRTAGAVHFLPGRLRDGDGAVSKYTAAVLAQHLRELRLGAASEVVPEPREEGGAPRARGTGAASL